MKNLVIFCFLWPALSFGGNENDPAGARAAGMGYAALGFQDIWSIYHNQAGIARVQSFTAGAFFENKFLVGEFAYAGFAAVSPLGAGAIGLSYTNFGYASYREGKAALAYALEISNTMSLGIQLNYHQTTLAADTYGNKNALTSELGIQVQVSSRVLLGAHIFNPTRAKLNDYNNERIPTVLRMGSTYRIAEDLLMSGEVEKDIDSDLIFRAGIEYKPAAKLYLRVGASSAPSLFTFGVGFDFDIFRIDLASTYHSVLGYSPQISLSYTPKNK